MINIFWYSRKSTESDERQVQSITDQTNWIHEKIWNNNIRLFIESKSAKDPYKRIEFDKLIKTIEKSKGENILYCWKLDRLSRNPVDSWMIQYLMQRWKLSKIITNDREYNPVDSWLLMSVENAMSNQFILDMVKNVERWMKSKIEKGWCIQNVPLWYKNNKETKEADIDNYTAPFIKEIFKLRADKKSLSEIIEIMDKRWLKWKNWWKLNKSTVDTILKNPFYIWFQKFQGKLYKSIHKKLINIELWEEVNGVKRWYKKHNLETEFPLKWIVKNFHNKKPLLALWKKKKYVYYSTHSRDEFIINMNQNHIIQVFDKVINQYYLNEELKPLILSDIKECYENYYNDIKEKKKTFELSLKKINDRCDKIFQLVCNNTISEEKYKIENNNLIIEQEKIEKELSNIQVIDRLIIDEAFDTVELLINLKTEREKASNDKKLKLIKMIVVELFVDTKKQLFIQEEELFEYIKVLNGLKWHGP